MTGGDDCFKGVVGRGTGSDRMGALVLEVVLTPLSRMIEPTALSACDIVSLAVVGAVASPRRVCDNAATTERRAHRKVAD